MSKTDTLKPGDMIYVAPRTPPLLVLSVDASEPIVVALTVRGKVLSLDTTHMGFTAEAFTATAAECGIRQVVKLT